MAKKLDSKKRELKKKLDSKKRVLKGSQ